MVLTLFFSVCVCMDQCISRYARRWGGKNLWEVKRMWWWVEWEGKTLAVLLFNIPEFFFSLRVEK